MNYINTINSHENTNFDNPLTAFTFYCNYNFGIMRKMRGHLRIWIIIGHFTPCHVMNLP